MVSSSAPPGPSKKHFRTKFTTKQMERMREFAHCVGWCIHKPDVAVVDAFGWWVGVSRRILKVWAYVGAMASCERRRCSFGGGGCRAAGGAAGWASPTAAAVVPASGSVLGTGAETTGFQGRRRA
ncbi:hypothetical protein GUJ93_ZPchr0015g6932 [Zizania palustris]|uniref:Uncharacterized protein n=1 Tax=Zizania palustris TaxID=103762 RepID=A0A8J5TLK7_ZIZPA|nr:hypothetical protein GUJ93_ZPchr0015g6932 [Zizania palustris]